MEIRKLVVVSEEIYADLWEPVDPPPQKALAAAVVRNPYAGRYEDALDELVAVGEELGALLGRRAVEALRGATPESYGKGAIVGLGGEWEHAAAVLHPGFGKPFREALGGGKALIPSTKKVASAGTALDVPLHHINAAFVRSHFDTVTIAIPDAPRADELVVVAAVGSVGRPHPRVGGLRQEEMTGEDGLR